MNPSRLLSCHATLLAGFLAFLGAWPGAAAGAAADKPRVVVLGFDGVDHELARQWMEAGHLPNFARLAEQGSFLPLTTANPAQSPVSWGVIVTGSNPGKSNLGDFVRRTFSPSGFPQPGLAGVKEMKEPVSAGELADRVQLEGLDRFLVPLGAERNAWIALALFTTVLFVVVALLLRKALRLPHWVGLPAALLLAGGAAYGAHRYLAELPREYPFAESELKGVRFWEPLAAAGLRFTGLQVPAAYPCEAQPNAKLLAGLFTPDVGGGIGTWYIYTNDEWAMSEESTSNGGRVLKMHEEADGAIRTFLRGPTDFVTKFGFEDLEQGLAEKLKAEGLGEAERQQLTQELNRAKNERRAWQNGKDRYSAVDLEVRPDYSAGTVRFSTCGQTQEVKEGAYSDWFRLPFKITGAFTVDAVARIFVQECRAEAGGEKKLKLFVPPISVSPENPPPHVPVSSPQSYAGELADAVGLYDTVGWACYTNALKDQETHEEAFLKGLELVMDWRTRMFLHELKADDWDVLFHMEGATDRAAHMLYAFFDPEHPHYDDLDPAGLPRREHEVNAYGRTFRLKDALLEVYREMDRIIGEALAVIDSGAAGPDVRLMIISDHGFESYRYGVDLNVWLNRMGYLARKGEGEVLGAPDGLKSGETGEFFSYVDWSRTRAYSMGLGKIYINLEGREPKGIVKREEYEALKAEIIQRLEAFVDPVEGHGKRRVALRAYDAFAVYKGPEQQISEFGDIILGFNSGYRAAGSCTTGGYDKNVYESFGIGVNDEPWSGDHCGVELSLVEGIFLANFKVQEGFKPDLLHIAPTVLDLMGVAIPESWDGSPIPR